MAVGADMSLPSSSRSPFRGGPAPSLGARPPMISDNAVSAKQNNLLAGAAGVGATAMQGMDRAGISRGKGQAFRADLAQAAADADASAQSEQAAMQASDLNARASQAYDTTMRGEQIANAGLLENLRAAGVREQLAKRGWQQDMNEAVRRGRFSLDSIYLDRTPLVDSLLRENG